MLHISPMFEEFIMFLVIALVFGIIVVIMGTSGGSTKVSITGESTKVSVTTLSYYYIASIVALFVYLVYDRIRHVYQCNTTIFKVVLQTFQFVTSYMVIYFVLSLIAWVILHKLFGTSMDIQFLYVLFLSTLSGAFLGVYMSYVGFRIFYGKVCLPVELRQKH